MKSRERSACPHPSGTGNQAGGSSSILYEVVRMESTSSSVRNEESSRRNFVCLVRSRTNGDLVLVLLVRGIKHAGIRTSGTKSHNWRAYPIPSGTKNQAAGTSSVMSLERRVCPRPSSTMSRERNACPLPSSMRNQRGRTSYVWTEVT